MWVFADSWFPFVRRKGIIYQSTMPSPTAWKRSSVSGFIGTTCLQSGSFSRALLIQLTKAYFSSSVDTTSNQSVYCAVPLPSFYWQRQNSQGSLSHQCDWSTKPCMEEALRRPAKELRTAKGLSWLKLPQYPFSLTGGCLGHEIRHITETGNEVHVVQMCGADVKLCKRQFVLSL